MRNMEVRKQNVSFKYFAIKIIKEMGQQLVKDMESREGLFKVGSYENTFCKLIVDQERRGKMMLQEREKERERENEGEEGRERDDCKGEDLEKDKRI